MNCRQTTITLIILLNVPDSSSNSNRMYLLGTGANQLCNIIAEQSYGDRVLAGQIRRRNDPPVYDIISLISIFISVHKTNVFTAQWVELARIRNGYAIQKQRGRYEEQIGIWWLSKQASVYHSYCEIYSNVVQMSSAVPREADRGPHV